MKPKSGTQAMIDFLKNLNEDPARMDAFVMNIWLDSIARENRLITWAATGIEPVWNLSDTLAYGMNYNYIDEEIRRSHDLFYAWHGNGD